MAMTAQFIAASGWGIEGRSPYVRCLIEHEHEDE
jgi:hypothetical protein